MSDDGPYPGDEPAAAPGEGGPRKSFWAHLDDLRSALVKAVIAIVVALILCLLLDAKIVGILEYPLRKMHRFDKPVPTVTIEVGANKMGPFEVTRDQFPALPPGPAPHATYRMTTVDVAGRHFVTLEEVGTAGAAVAGDAETDPIEIRLHNLSPSEAFMVAFHTAIYAALAISSPLWIYFIGGFLLPALNRKERKVIIGWMGWSIALFAAGVLLTYFLLLPIALRASVQYSKMLGFEANDWRADEYIHFAAKFLFGMGLGFQFPLVVLFLVKMGILTHAHLSRYRRHVIVLSLILGAVLTTPEVVTQVAMAVPLYILYEACVWIAWYWERKAKRAPLPVV